MDDCGGILSMNNVKVMCKLVFSLYVIINFMLNFSLLGLVANKKGKLKMNNYFSDISVPTDSWFSILSFASDPPQRSQATESSHQ